MTYTDPIAAPEKAVAGGENFELPVKWGMDMQSEHERWHDREARRPLLMRVLLLALAVWWLGSGVAQAKFTPPPPNPQSQPAPAASTPPAEEPHDTQPLFWYGWELIPGDVLSALLAYQGLQIGHHDTLLWAGIVFVANGPLVQGLNRQPGRAGTSSLLRLGAVALAVAGSFALYDSCNAIEGWSCPGTSHLAIGSMIFGSLAIASTVDILRSVRPRPTTLTMIVSPTLGSSGATLGFAGRF